MTGLASGAVIGVLAGLDLFLAVGILAALGAATDTLLDRTLEDLGRWWITLVALGLYGWEAYAERHPVFDLLWRSAGALVRPSGAAALAALASPEPSLGVPVAALLALWVHAARSGRAFLAEVEGRGTDERALLAEDGVVVAGVALLWAPASVQLVLSAAILLGLLTVARPWPRAFAVAVSLPPALARSLLAPFRWASPRRFPDWIKRELAPAAVVTGGRLRAAPLFCLDPAGPGSLRRGWLVVRGASPKFVRRRRRDLEILTLEPATAQLTSTTAFWTSVRVRTDRGRAAVLLSPPDGPGRAELLRELC